MSVLKLAAGIGDKDSYLLFLLCSFLVCTSAGKEETKSDCGVDVPQIMLGGRLAQVRNFAARNIKWLFT